MAAVSGKRRGAAARAIMGHLGVTEPEDGMRTLARQLLECHGNQSPPSNLEELARLAGIDAVEARDLDVDGDLIACGGRLVARVDIAATIGRRRFTLAHEIAHALLLPLLGRVSKTMACGRDRELERLCDVAATELLLPAEEMKGYVSEHGLAIQAVVEAARLFQVSLQAASLRVAELVPNCRGIAMFEQEDGCSDMEVVWGVGRMRHAFSDEAVMEAMAATLATGTPNMIETFVGAGGQARRCGVETKRLARTPRGLAMLRDPRRA